VRVSSILLPLTFKIEGTEDPGQRPEHSRKQGRLITYSMLGLHPGKMDASIPDSLVSHTVVVSENLSVFTTNRHGSALEGLNDAPTSTSFNFACHCRDASSKHTDVLYSICTAGYYQNKYFQAVSMCHSS
jgi:hypothetical protein